MTCSDLLKTNTGHALQKQLHSLRMTNGGTNQERGQEDSELVLTTEARSHSLNGKKTTLAFSILKNSLLMVPPSKKKCYRDGYDPMPKNHNQVGNHSDAFGPQYACLYSSCASVSSFNHFFSPMLLPYLSPGVFFNFNS